jgi:spore coat protein SA
MVPSKIAFVTPGSFPIPSPNSSSVERIIEHYVPLLDRSRIEPRIYGRIGPRLRRIGRVGSVRCDRFPAANKARYVRSVARAIRIFAPSIIHVENRPIVAHRMKRRFPRRQVWLSLQSNTFIGRRYISRDRLLRSLAAADRIIVNSHWLEGHVASLVPSEAHKLYVVQLGVDTARFRSRFSPEGEARRRELREKRGWKSRKVVLFMGRVIPRKGVHHLVDALPELVREHPDVLLVIVGSPFYGSHRTTSYSRGLVRAGAPLKNWLQFIPYVPYTEVPDWFLAADVAVVPSDANEAFGLVNVEAMACGLPVVATRSGGMPEIVEDGVTGFLADPKRVQASLAEKLGLLLRDEELRNRLGANSRARVEERFTWQRSAEAWMRLYEETRR